MKIKRIFAQDMRQAFRKVREEHGPDAVILSSRNVDGGVEVISAIDYDERVITAAARREQESRPPREDFASTLDSLKARAMLTGVNPAAPESRPLRQKLDVLLDDEPELDDPGVADYLRPAARPAPKGYEAAAAERAPRGIEAEAAERAPRGIEAAAAERAPRGIEAAAAERARARGIEPGPQDIEWTQEPALREMRQELKTLRSLFENQLKLMEWNGMGRQQPVRSLLHKQLTELGLGPDVCRKLADHVVDQAPQADPEACWALAVQTLEEHLAIDDEDLLADGGIVALVGPTGVGKTTTIAKLAARFALRHGRQHVALVSTDNFRIGAQDQLRNFARILGVPMHTANSAEELASVLDGLRGKRLVLIDTAGMSQRDMRLSEQFQALRESDYHIRSYLVLSANTQLSTLNEVVRSFKGVKPEACILTKLDEATSLGGALTVTLRYRIPLAYLGIGQRVPEDLQPARAGQLIAKAQALVANYRQETDDDTLALSFGGIANAG